MLIPHKRDTVHRFWLLRLLSAIADDRVLMMHLRFKGGTCAAMRNLLDRFSVDLDFDLLSPDDISVARRHLENIFKELQLSIKDQSTAVPQYFLHYDSPTGQRSTIALDITVPPPTSNTYETVRLPDIDRFMPCQTIATMVANKLVTPLDRFRQHGAIAGRDIYDIHHFLFRGLPWNMSVIEERSGMLMPVFRQSLLDFIAENVTQTVIDQDLNTLLQPKQFQAIRRSLKQETLSLLRQHIA
jgi:predicted nucleotidyltransferase component of viral defense system